MRDGIVVAILLAILGLFTVLGRIVRPPAKQSGKRRPLQDQ